MAKKEEYSHVYKSHTITGGAGLFIRDQLRDNQESEIFHRMLNDKANTALDKVNALRREHNEDYERLIAKCLKSVEHQQFDVEKIRTRCFLIGLAVTNAITLAVLLSK